MKRALLPPLSCSWQRLALSLILTAIGRSASDCAPGSSAGFAYSRSLSSLLESLCTRTTRSSAPPCHSGKAHALAALREANRRVILLPSPPRDGPAHRTCHTSSPRGYLVDGFGCIPSGSIMSNGFFQERCARRGQASWNLVADVKWTLHRFHFRLMADKNSGVAGALHEGHRRRRYAHANLHLRSTVTSLNCLDDAVTECLMPHER